MDLPNWIIIPDTIPPDRADRVLAVLLAGERSRSALHRLLRMGRALVRGNPLRPSSTLRPGDHVVILPDTSSDSQIECVDVPAFSVTFEDEHVVVLDKPPGLVVHPAAGCRALTLMDKLIQTRPEMMGVGEPNRWGIVHRLDKDTSGVMVVAKTEQAHAALSAQFKEHSVHRIYLALVKGSPVRDAGLIETPLGRHVKDRKRISTHTRKARPAVTHWRVLERFQATALLEIRPETGRTHQIRVHLASAGLPVVGDQVYGKGQTKPERKSRDLWRDVGQVLKRQALHAAELGFHHPETAEYVAFTSPLPRDIVQAVQIVASSKSENAS